VVNPERIYIEWDNIDDAFAGVYLYVPELPDTRPILITTADNEGRRGRHDGGTAWRVGCTTRSERCSTRTLADLLHNTAFPFAALSGFSAGFSFAPSFTYAEK